MGLQEQVTGTHGAPCVVSIIIKALNEERRIDAAVGSALRAIEAIAPLRGEVVLADSCSSDATVARASQYPIRIVQLADASERSCGIGPQLGWQHAQGEFVYILDGDMEMLPGFLPAALALLHERPDIAGVAGQVVETNTTSLEYIGRMERAERHMRPGPAQRLEMGGLYRRSAIEQVGYFSDRNLHSYEELDLAARLCARGWKLWRLPTPAVLHEGHDAPALQLLRRRWRSRYIDGIGELARSAWGRPHWPLVLDGAREMKLYAAVAAWWLLLLTVPLWPLPVEFTVIAFLLLLAAPWVLMTWRKRSITKAAFAVTSWSFHAAGLIRGLLRARRSPMEPIRSHVLREATDAQESAAPMKVSVVIALYNKAPYVHAAVQSALAQRHPVHEVIVVDDGSTDGGAQQLAGIQDPRLRVVRQDNAGVSVARNHGISLATGDWVAFLDADDWLHPDLLRGFAQAHQAWPNAGMIGAPYRLLAPGVAPEQVRWPRMPLHFEIEHVTDLHRRWMLTSPFAASSVAIRTDLLQAMQPCFPPTETYGEDLDLWFRVAERTSVALVNAELSAYRTLDNGLSARNPRSAEPPYLERMRQRIRRGETPAALRESARWFIGQQQVTLARAALGGGRRLEALAILLRARGVCTTRRWQMSLVMALFFPARMVVNWQQARLEAGARRKAGRASLGRATPAEAVQRN